MNRSRSWAPCLLATVLTASVCAAPVPASYADYASSCASPTRTLTGDRSASFSVAAGETLRLTGGSFTGGVDAFPAGSTLCVSPTATLAPAYLNNAAGALVVAADGQVHLPSIAVATGFSLDNAGSFRADSLNVNGAATLHNAAGGTFRVTGNFSPAAGSITNDGVMTLAGGANLNTQVSVDNAAALAIDGTLTVNGALRNTGAVKVSGQLTVNGSGQLANSCSLVVGAGLSNNGAGSSNSGITVVHQLFSNNGTWTQTNTGILGAASLSNDGTVSGLGRYRFAGDTRTQGTFAGTSSGNPIVVDDRTPPPPPRIFDTQSGTVQNVVAGPVEPPLVGGRAVPGCSGSVDPPTNADVETTKAAPGEVAGGDPLTFTVSVTNHGPGDAAEVVVTDRLPGTLGGPVVASDGGVVSAGTVTWSLGTVAAGTTRTFTVSGTAPPVGTLVNTVSSTSTTADPDPSNNDGSAAAATTTTTVEPPTPPDPPPAPDYERTTYTWLPAVGQIPDSGGDLRYSLLTRPAHGTLTVAADGTLVYTPDSDFTGIDSFRYQVCTLSDPPVCSAGTVTINVLPAARDDVATTSEDTPVGIAVLANDTDGAPVTSTSGGPAHGAVSVGADGRITYTPDPGFTGDDAFSYTICSPTEPTFCDTADVTVTVLPVNHPPRAPGSVHLTQVGNRVTGQVQATDPDGDPLTFALETPPVHGRAVVRSDGSFGYRPDDGYAGHDSFTVVVCDAGDPVLCTTATVHIAIRPIARDDRARTTEHTAVRIWILQNDEGRHRPPELRSRAAHGSVVRRAGSFVYRPVAGFTGRDTFRYRICTPGAVPLCAGAQVRVLVTKPGGGGGLPS